MTRLLVPEMFGVMAIAIMLIVGIGLFSDLGLRQSVVQSKRGDNPGFLNTVWVIQILRGVLIFLVSLALSLGLVVASRTDVLMHGSTYSEPILPAVLAVTSFGAVIAGFESTKLLTANRDLVLGRITLIELSSQTIGLAAMVMIALVNRSIWALVIGSLVAAITKTALSHVALSGPGNRFRWDQESFNQIIGFGKWIFASSVLGVLLISGDRLLLGGLVSADVLGYYSIAFLITNAAKELFQRLITNVAFPTLSETVRQQPDSLALRYYKLRTPIDLTSLFVLGFLFVSGERLIEILYDPRFRPAGHYLEILAWSMFTVRFGIAGQCYLALGKPAIVTMLIATSLVGLYGSVPIAFYFFGLNGALWAIALSPCLSIPQMYFLNYKHGLLNVSREIALLLALPIGIAAGYGFESLYQIFESAITPN